MHRSLHLFGAGMCGSHRDRPLGAHPRERGPGFAPLVVTLLEAQAVGFSSTEHNFLALLCLVFAQHLAENLLWRRDLWLLRAGSGSPVVGWVGNLFKGRAFVSLHSRQTLQQTRYVCSEISPTETAPM